MLADILGHTNTRLIDRVFSHLLDKDLEELRQQMSAQPPSGVEPTAGANAVDLRTRRASSRR